MSRPSDGFQDEDARSDQDAHVDEDPMDKDFLAFLGGVGVDPDRQRAGQEVKEIPSTSEKIRMLSQIMAISGRSRRRRSVSTSSVWL